MLSDRRAIAYVERVGVSVKSGLAKRLPKRKSKATIPQARVVLFNGIRVTRRAQRFDQRRIVARQATKMPNYLAEEMAR